MKDIFNNKFTDQVSLTNDFLVPEVSNYLQINETEIEASAKKLSSPLGVTTHTTHLKN